jgi:aspartyl protease family protein
MRSYLFIVLAFGLMASVLSHRPATAPSAPLVASTETSQDVGSTQSSEAPSATGAAGELERNSDGHFYADVEVNGVMLHMLVDTGASGIALSRDDARAAGIATSIGMNDVVGEGADGSVHGEVVQIGEIALAGRTAHDVPAIVLNSGERSLLGQSFLENFDSVEIHGDRMILR